MYLELPAYNDTQAKIMSHSTAFFSVILEFPTRDIRDRVEYTRSSLSTISPGRISFPDDDAREDETARMHHLREENREIVASGRDRRQKRKKRKLAEKTRSKRIHQVRTKERTVGSEKRVQAN